MVIQAVAKASKRERKPMPPLNKADMRALDAQWRAEEAEIDKKAMKEQ